MTVRYILLLLAFTVSAPAADTYNREIRPILSDACFHCHGPDKAKRKAGRRLDTFAGATEVKDGIRAIHPGDPANSEMIRRITSTDPEERMPPPKSGRKLNAQQIKHLKNWVQSGAEYQDHWAFIPPAKTKLPAASTWTRNAIDRFTEQRHASEGLQPRPEADRATLVRRVAQDLTGLPPSLAELDRFGKDNSEAGYQAMVDHFLASPRYGERMAYLWLDAARYADTDGYQNDGERTMWPWRDWVIKAYNDNLPFDRFSIEQLAGDLLPDASPMHQLATGFNRNHRINNEGGALPEEFIVEYSVDRLETTFAVWQGLTIGCARCHDHKYDPLTQKEFYRLYAYFNSIPEAGKASGKNAAPTIRMASPLAGESQSAAKEKGELAELQERKKQVEESLAERQAAWEKSAAVVGLLTNEVKEAWSTVSNATVQSLKGSSWTAQDDGSFLDSGKRPPQEHLAITIPVEDGTITALKLEALKHPSLGKPAGLARSVNGNFVLTYLSLEYEQAGERKPVNIARAEADFAQKDYPLRNALVPGATGWAVHGGPGEQRTALFVFEEAIQAELGGVLHLQLKFESTFAGHVIGRPRFKLTGMPSPMLEETRSALSPKLLAALRIPADQRKPGQQTLIRKHYTAIDETLKKINQQISAMEKKIQAIENKQVVTVMVMKDLPTPRPSYLLERGSYEHPDKSEVLSRDVPASLKVPGMEAPADRLAFAKWLVSADNPLTARVTVNRYWQMFFGTGIVKTTEDFGAQGEWPSHPELLDWLAVDFMENGWDIKRMHQFILSSATYRQDSRSSKTLVARDPQNRLLAHGPRYRLDAAQLRDQALSISGLLKEKMGGPPVKPYQPTGLWNSVSANAGTRYALGKGEDLYRLSMYTYWKRAVAPPRQIIFDSATREACNLRHRVTNTPLQALVLMNDVTYLEAARAFAEDVFKQPGDADARLRYAYRKATARPPSSRALQVLQANHAWFTEHYTADPEAAKAFLSAGQSPRNDQLDPVQHAAMAQVCHLLLNLDRTITKE